RWSPSKAPTVTALVIGPLRLPAPPSPRSRPARSPRPLAPRPGEHQVRASQQPRAAPLALNQLTEPEEPAVRTLEHDRSWSPGERKTSSGPEHRPGCRRDAPAVPDVLGRGSVEPLPGEDLHAPRLAPHLDATARQAVETLAADLDGRDHRRDLLDLTHEGARRLAHALLFQPIDRMPLQDLAGQILSGGHHAETQ